jgi:hypothetical protein
MTPSPSQGWVQWGSTWRRWKGRLGRRALGTRTRRPLVVVVDDWGILHHDRNESDSKDVLRVWAPAWEHWHGHGRWLGARARLAWSEETWKTNNLKQWSSWWSDRVWHRPCLQPSHGGRWLLL